MKQALFLLLIFSNSLFAQVNLNQTLVAYYPFNRNANDPGYDLFLGRLSDPQFPYWFNGVMDEVRIYNRALKQYEINAFGDYALSSCNNLLSLPSQPSYVNVG